MAVLAPWRSQGVVAPLDAHFAATVARLTDSREPAVVLALALASGAAARGDVCLDLDAPPIVDTLGSALPLSYPAPNEWRRALLEATRIVGDGVSDARPLVLEESRLYLYRYWAYERSLGSALAARAAMPLPHVNTPALRDTITSLFDNDNAGDIDWQQVAVALASLRRLVVITGGPGTGKTTTVVRILASHVATALASSKSIPRIALAAPTGKAAARMMSALRNGAASSTIREEVRAALPTRATTIHRLLGAERDAARFRRNAKNPLPADIVIVDEVSMVDLALLAKLVDALLPDATLILLGDRDQLASVEAGAVLRELVPENDVAYTPDVRQSVAAITGQTSLPVSADAPPFANSVVHLTRTYRFHERGEIATLSHAIAHGDAEQAMALLDAAHADSPIAFLPLENDRRSLAVLRDVAIAGYRTFLRESEPHVMLDLFDRFRVLCAHRDGWFGAEGVNRFLTDQLARASLISASPPDEWWHGRPVLLTANDQTLDVFNGDTAIIVRRNDRSVRAYLWGDDANMPRAIPPARLPAHETAFAITVHKSQGSEFDHVVLVLPPHPTRVVTRELLYTAVSRARQRVTIVGARETIAAGIAMQVRRASGLRTRLWGPTSVTLPERPIQPVYPTTPTTAATTPIQLDLPL